jgi:DNA (cytosine-5)-methyltransferase 1
MAIDARGETASLVLRATANCTTPMLKRTARIGLERRVSAIDLFCGAGGLTRGLIDKGIDVVAGVDIDAACKYPYERNNSAKFLQSDVAKLSGEELSALYPEGSVKVLVGCPPCQPFSKYTQGLNTKADAKWSLLRVFGHFVDEMRPDVVSMENVPELQKHTVFTEFIETLKRLKYGVSYSVVFCPDYGLPQYRSRLVLFASRLGPIEIIKPTHRPAKYLTVKAAIAKLSPLEAGGADESDPLHRCSTLSPRNLQRIRASHPGGTWRDWDSSLVAMCHKRKSGKSYIGVYGRMDWNTPSPTITTQFFGFGSGRFGHPEQHRAISLREGAILQSFPKRYVFVRPGSQYSIKVIGRLIGNAVPVKLGRAVGNTIKRHLSKYEQ